MALAENRPGEPYGCQRLTPAILRGFRRSRRIRPRGLDS
jgi:hypothetical protein